MKTSIKLIALLTAAAYPCAAFAEVAGASVSAALTTETSIGLFSAAFFAVLMIGDYSRRVRSLPRLATAAASARKHESHRLAA